MRVKDIPYIIWQNLKWRNLNKHNYTTLHCRVEIDRIVIGKGTYGGLNVLMDGTDGRLYIGHYCSIGPEVTFVLSSDHNLYTATTYPFKVKYLKTVKREAISKGDIRIDDDVWIGTRATILSGVHVGQGAVIGACSCVTKDIPPYAIVGGNPARVIKFRFPENIIKLLIKCDISKIDNEFVLNNLDYLYANVKSPEDINFLLLKCSKKGNSIE